MVRRDPSCIGNGLSSLFGFYVSFMVLYWIFSFGYCYDTVCLYFTYFVHVVFLYDDTRCYDDIHEVTLAFPPLARCDRLVSEPWL